MKNIRRNNAMLKHALMIFCLLSMLGILSAVEPKSENTEDIKNKENLQKGLSIVDENGNLVLVSKLNEIGKQSNITTVSELLKSWEKITCNKPVDRYIAAVAIAEHLRKRGLDIELSLVRITHDPESKHHQELLSELRQKLDSAWEIKSK